MNKPQCGCLDCRYKRHASACRAQIAKRRRRMRRVAFPTNLPDVWILRPGKTFADWEKARIRNITNGKAVATRCNGTVMAPAANV